MKRPHFALPEIYDDSLSYYDVLRKLIKSMHAIVDNLNKIPEQIANEAKARLLGDQNLQQNINTEKSAREQADTTLQQNINTEKSAREQADTTLQQNINSEATTREQADREIREGVSNKINELKGDLSDFQTDVATRTENLIDPRKLVEGYCRNKDGKEEKNTWYLMSNQFVAVSPGEKLQISGTQLGARRITAYDDNMIVLPSLGTDDAVKTFVIPDGVSFVRMTFTKGDTLIMVNKGDVSLPYVEYKWTLDYSKIIGTPNVVNESGYSETALMSQLSVTLADEATLAKLSSVSKNMFDSSNIGIGYIDLAGRLDSDAPNYRYTDFIPVNSGEKVNTSFTARFITAYNSSKVAVSESGIENVNTYTVPDNIRYIRISFWKFDFSNAMVNIGERLLPFEEFGKRYVKQSYGYVNSSCGGNSASITAESVMAGSTVNIFNFPKYLKNGMGINAFAKFGEFTSISIGKGFEEYRGKWLVIDGTNATWYAFESTTGVMKQTAHGLDISDFVNINLYFDENGKCKYTIVSKTGSFTDEINVEYECNGTPFLTVGQDCTEVKFSAVSTKSKCGMWLFGDSYFGAISSARVIGQLKTMGFADGVLIDGIAGQTATEAYSDFTKLLNLGGVPKYLVWYLGMNGNASQSINVMKDLQELSARYGFELILNKVPVVSSRVSDISAYNSDVIISGCRYIDSDKAVGSNGTGTWYDGYLDSDGVHPTELGAKALSSRILTDVPEIMQYGYSPTVVNGTISGDK